MRPSGSSADFTVESKILHRELSRPYWSGAFDPGHPDTERHFCMLSSSDGLLDHLRPESILSVGDNLARDAGYFKRRFPQARCVATDLYADRITQAVQDGWVDEVLSADVENLPFGDASVDCVIAKEAFHHWPRPMLGFYEMLRVARKAVLLIEPYDSMREPPQPFMGSSAFHDDYEDVGNYVYRLSLREVLKAAWSLYLPAVAAVGFNDPYAPGRPVHEWKAEKQWLDQLGDRGERQFNLMSIAVYKPGFAPAAGELRERIQLYLRPRNPFIEPA